MWSLSPPTVHVALSAQRVVIAQTPRMWPASGGNFECIECAPESSSTSSVPGTSSNGAAVWRPAVQTLEKWLSVQRHTPAVHIVLSARFVRWQLLEYRPELSRPAELAAYAALRFKDTFGTVAQEWQILHSPQPPGHAVPACAIDLALLEALRKLGSGKDVDAGARLLSVTPYFSVAFDRWRASLKDKACWFGVVEPDCVSLALLCNGSLAGLRLQRLDSALRDVLPPLMAQMRIASGVADTHGPLLPLYLVGDGEPPILPADMGLHWLRSKAQQAPAQVGIRMALGV